MMLNSNSQSTQRTTASPVNSGLRGNVGKLPLAKRSDGSASLPRIATPQLVASTFSEEKPEDSPFNPQRVSAHAGNLAALVWNEQITDKLLWMIGGFIALLLIAIPIIKHNSAKHSNIYNPPKGAALNIVLNTTTGEPFALSSLRGRVVLLNVWSTWCVPCRKEIPVLNALQNEYEARGLTVVGISWNDTPDDIKRFQKEKTPQNYTVLLQGKSLQSTFGGLDGLPVTYLIDRQGQIRQVLLGANDRTTLESAIRSLLDTP